MSDKYYVGSDVTIFADNGKYKPISRVTLLVDDENSLTAGDDTGMEVIASCPHATQPMVNALLQTMKGYRYQAYEAGAANIDPAAELGDGVTVGGIYSPLSKLSDDGRGYAGISSPGEAEMEDEYPSGGYITQEFNRKIAETRSTIAKTSDAINLRIDGVTGDVSSLQVSLGNVQSEVSGKIDGSTAQSLINQSIDKIELSVSSGSGGSTFTLKAGSTTLSTDTLDLHVNAVNIDGTLKANQIQTGSIYVGDLADGSDYATKTYVDNNAGLSSSEVDDRIDTYIDSTSITAEILRGRTVSLMANRRTEIGTIELVDTTTGYGVSISTYDGGIQLNSGGNIYLSADSDRGAFVTIADDYISFGRGALIIGSNVYGTSLPSRPQYGQLFFLKQ